MKHVLGSSLLMAAMLVLAACGDDQVRGTTCEVGESCPCNVPADCPTGETCEIFSGVCVAADVDGTSDADDAAGDAGTDTTDTTGTPDADVVEPDADVVDPDADDILEDGDATDPDVDIEDVSDADTIEPDADVADADPTDGSAETDTGSGVGINDPWVLWEEDYEGRPTVAFGRIGFEETQVIELPIDGGTGNPTTENAQPSWSHDGTEVIVRSFVPRVGFQIRIFDVTDGSQEEINPNEGDLRNISTPSLSPDADRFVITARGSAEESTVRRLFVVDRATGVATPITEDNMNVAGPVWIEDGRIIFNCDDTRTPEVCVINADGTELDVLTRGSNIVGNPAANGDASLLAWVSSTGVGDQQLVVFNVEEDEAIVQVDIPDVGGPAFSPDGRYVTFSQSNPSTPATGQDLGYADVQTGSYLGIFRTTDNREQGPHFGPVNTEDLVLVLPSAD